MTMEMEDGGAAGHSDLEIRKCASVWEPNDRVGLRQRSIAPVARFRSRRCRGAAVTQDTPLFENRVNGRAGLQRQSHWCALGDIGQTRALFVIEVAFDM